MTEPLPCVERPVLKLAFLAGDVLFDEDECVEKVASWLAWHEQRCRVELYTPGQRRVEKLACRTAARLRIPWFACCRRASTELYFNEHFPVLGLYRVNRSLLLPPGLRKARYEVLA